MCCCFDKFLSKQVRRCELLDKSRQHRLKNHQLLSNIPSGCLTITSDIIDYRNKDKDYMILSKHSPNK